MLRKIYAWSEMFPFKGHKRASFVGLFFIPEERKCGMKTSQRTRGEYFFGYFFFLLPNQTKHETLKIEQASLVFFYKLRNRRKELQCCTWICINMGFTSLVQHNCPAGYVSDTLLPDGCMVSLDGWIVFWEGWFCVENTMIWHEKKPNKRTVHEGRKNPPRRDEHTHMKKFRI